MYSGMDHNYSLDASCLDHSISDDDDVVDPQQLQSRNSPSESSDSKVNNREARHNQDNIDKTMTSSLSSSTFSSAASQRDSIYSLARSSTVASSINDQNSPGSDNEARKRWSAGSLSSIDDIISTYLIYVIHCQMFLLEKREDAGGTKFIMRVTQTWLSCAQPTKNCFLAYEEILILFNSCVNPTFLSFFSSLVSPQKMTLLQVKSVSNGHSTMTSNTLDSMATQNQIDVRRTATPNRTIMSVLDHGRAPEPEYYQPRSRSSSHNSENEFKDIMPTRSSSRSSSDNSTITPPKERPSWTSQSEIPATMSGWLLRHNATHFTFTTPWKRYYYVLVGNALHEYKTDKSDSPHRDQLDLSSDTLVFVNEGFPGKTYVLEIRKPGRRMCLQCTDAENMKQWMHYLKQSIAQIKRSNSLQRSASITNSTIGQISQDETSSHPSNENTSQTTMRHTHTPPITSQPSQVIEPQSKKLSRTSSRLNEIPPQLPPPSRSPPPVPKA
ncbi:hypothetical protein NQZ79_g3155 [Umbelopsis isabellina]|nr:hypothetical protein NQZ79_g3155 [Umbelopsis isabellina]